MRQVLARLVQPAGALMARLRYAQKFALIAVVMLAPLAYVAYEYRSGQRFQIDFSAKERLGVEYVRPAADLLIALVEGRDLAVRAAAGDADAAGELPAQRERIESALRAVGAVDARLGRGPRDDGRVGRAAREGRHRIGERHGGHWP